MNQKLEWLPVDERLIPKIFSFRYPKNPWVRGMLILEMVMAIIALAGTLVLVILPNSTTQPTSATATQSPAY